MSETAKTASYQMKECDRDHICRKYYNPDEPHDGYQRFRYHGYDYDEATGLSDESIKEGVRSLLADLPAHTDNRVAKAKAIEYVLDHTRIDVNDSDWYVGIYSWGRVIYHDYIERRLDEVKAKSPRLWDEIGLLRASGTADIWPDFDHSVPDWDAIMGLGLEMSRYVQSKESPKSEITQYPKPFHGVERSGTE